MNMQIISFNIRLFLFSRFILGISSNMAVFSSIWWFTSAFESYYFSGLVYFIYRTLEIYLMPFTSAIADSVNRQYLLFLSAMIVLLILAVYALSFTVFGAIPVILCILCMIILGVLSSINVGLMSVFLHDVYQKRISVVLRLNSFFVAISLIVTPIFSIGYTISFGSEATIYTAFLIAIPACFVQFKCLNRFVRSKNVEAEIRRKFSIIFAIKNSLHIITATLNFKIERDLIIVLFLLNMIMTPFFMVSFPFLASINHFQFQQAVAIFDLMFGVGFILSSRFLMKYMSAKIDSYSQILIGLILLIIMLCLSLMFINIILISFFCFLGGLGLPLVVLNITSHRVSHCPNEIKSQLFGTLVFFSLAGNPISILITTFLLEKQGISSIIFYNCTLTLLSLSYFIIRRKTLNNVNLVTAASRRLYRRAYIKD